MFPSLSIFLCLSLSVPLPLSHTVLKTLMLAGLNLGIAQLGTVIACQSWRTAWSPRKAQVAPQAIVLEQVDSSQTEICSVGGGLAPSAVGDSDVVGISVSKYEADSSSGGVGPCRYFCCLVRRRPCSGSRQPISWGSALPCVSVAL